MLKRQERALAIRHFDVTEAEVSTACRRLAAGRQNATMLATIGRHAHWQSLTGCRILVILVGGCSGVEGGWFLA